MVILWWKYGDKWLSYGENMVGNGEHAVDMWLKMVKYGENG